MNFCPKCEFLLFTKINPDTKKLQNYCKNCFWVGDYVKENTEDDKIVVYEKNYNNDFVSDSIISNPNIIYDHTLPRINNIKCINDKCSSNLSTKLTIKMVIEYKNDPEKLITENIDHICYNFITTQGITIHKSDIQKVSHNTFIANFKSTANKQQIESLGKTDFDKYSITMKKFRKSLNEIIFLKYNEKELKYMYICANCMTSWKN